MRIHSDTLTYSDFFAAADYVKSQTGSPVYFHGGETLPRHGSRSRRYGWTVKLASNGTLTRRRVNAGSSRSADRFDLPYAATWQQWGHLLTFLFDRDPNMTIPGVYADRDAFHAATHGEFLRTVKAEPVNV